MSVLINFKMCDNAPECGGIAVCPTGALSWDQENECIKIDNDKCISCGSCEKECPIGAITVAYTDEEYKKKKEEIDNDPRTIKDLFTDRYGCVPLSEGFITDEERLDSKIRGELVLVECDDEDAYECLLKSIPIKELTENLPDDTRFYKLPVKDKTKEKYGIDTLPALLVFKEEKLVGKVEGYYTVDNKEELLNKIKDFC